MKHIYPKNVYELREFLFGKLNVFKLPYKDEQKIFIKMGFFDFESLCVKADSHNETDYKVDREACTDISFYFM